MRRPVTLLVLLCALVATAAGCGSAEVVSPTAQTVIGTLPKQQALPPGDPTAGKAVFLANGCGGCHTFTPAGTNGTVGPDLDKLPELAQKANQGTVKVFVLQSITNPSAYVESGYPDIMPKDYGDKLSRKQLADLVAFLTTKS